MRPRLRTRVVAAAGLALAGVLLATGLADPVRDEPGTPETEIEVQRPEERTVWLTSPDGRPLPRELFAGSSISPGGRLSETVVVHRRDSVGGPDELRVRPVSTPGPLERQVRITVDSAGVRRTLRLGRLLREVRVLRLTESLGESGLPVTLTVHLPRSAGDRTAATATRFELALTASDAPPGPVPTPGTGAPGDRDAAGSPGAVPADDEAPAPAAPTLPVVLLMLASLVGAGLALLVGRRAAGRAGARRRLSPPPG